MKRIVKEAWQRTDLLIVFLAIILSILLYARFGESREEIEISSAAVAVAEDDVSEAASVDASQTKKRPARAGAPVRFLMYNVHDYFVDKDPKRSPHTHTRRIKPKDQREAVAQVIASVRPQVVGLVEIGGPAALDDLAERLASRGLIYPYRKTLVRWGEDRALGILSQHPIVNDHSIADCALVGRTKKPMLRGILDVTVQLESDKRAFRIIGAHLKSQVSDNPEAAEIQRSREARTLAEHIERAMKSEPQMPLLVYGDWNDGPKAPALAVLTSIRTDSNATLKRLSPKDSHDETWTIYYKEGNEYNTFDQIYVNSELSRRMGRKSEMGIVSEPAGAKASDHRAVWCDMY